MKEASLGVLRSGAEDKDAPLEPVRRNPDLWEIRWAPKPAGRRRLGEFRMYHAEPGGNPDIVALRFHRKETFPALNRNEQDQAIEDTQDAEIDEAGKRHRVGEPNRWGHTTRCVTCVEPIN